MSEESSNERAPHDSTPLPVSSSTEPATSSSSRTSRPHITAPGSGLRAATSIGLGRASTPSVRFPSLSGSAHSNSLPAQSDNPSTANMPAAESDVSQTEIMRIGAIILARFLHHFDEYIATLNRFSVGILSIHAHHGGSITYPSDAYPPYLFNHPPFSFTSPMRGRTNGDDDGDDEGENDNDIPPLEPITSTTSLHSAPFNPVLARSRLPRSRQLDQDPITTHYRPAQPSSDDAEDDDSMPPLEIYMSSNPDSDGEMPALERIPRAQPLNHRTAQPPHSPFGAAVLPQPASSSSSSAHPSPSPEPPSSDDESDSPPPLIPVDQPNQPSSFFSSRNYARPQNPQFTSYPQNQPMRNRGLTLDQMILALGTNGYDYGDELESELDEDEDEDEATDSDSDNPPPLERVRYEGSQAEDEEDPESEWTDEEDVGPTASAESHTSLPSRRRQPHPAGSAPHRRIAPLLAPFLFNTDPDSRAAALAYALGPASGVAPSPFDLSIDELGRALVMFNPLEFFGDSHAEPTPDPVRARQLITGLERVSPYLLQRLEKVEKAGGAEEERTGGCAVCWDGYEGTPEGSNIYGSDVLVLPCVHVFHRACLEPWFASHTTCPVCRFDIDPNSLTLRPDSSRTASSSTARSHWTAPKGSKTLKAWVEEREQQLGITPPEPPAHQPIDILDID